MGVQSASTSYCFLRERDLCMKLIIDSILKAEQEAKIRIEKAQKNVAQKKAQAEAEADSMVQKAKEQAALLTKQKLDEAKQQAARLIETHRQNREELFAEQYRQLEPVIEQAVQIAVKIVSTSVLDSES